MPIKKSRMKALKERYGEKKGEEIYYKMEQEEKKKHSPNVKVGYHG